MGGRQEISLTSPLIPDPFATIVGSEVTGLYGSRPMSLSEEGSWMQLALFSLAPVGE